MDITDIRIFIRDSSSGSKLKAYATITLDGIFVVRNLKVIEGTKGLFVAMPSERAKEPCPSCSFRNAVRSHFCSQCGKSLPSSGGTQEDKGHDAHTEGAAGEHRDIAHPITSECREMIQHKVLEAYEAAKKEGQQPPPKAPPQQPPQG